MAKSTTNAKATPPKPSASTAVANWDEQLAREAEVAAQLEQNVGGGQFFSLRGGTLSFNDAPVPGNHMGVVLVASMFENVLYPEGFDADSPQPPICFAFAERDEDLAPHETVVARDQQQHETCAGCPMNDWGTADRGRGKACRNTRRLAVLAAGALDEHGRFTPTDDADELRTAPLGFLRVPVTSIKGYANFVKQTAGALKRPPHGIYTRVRLVPDPKTQIKLLFEPLGPVPGELMGAVMERRAAAQPLLDAPYPLDAREEAAPAAGKGAKGGGRPTPRGNVQAPVKPASNRPAPRGGKAGGKY